MELEAQLNLMYEWFQGSFSNNMQYQRDKRDQEKVGGEPLRDHVWVKFFKVDVPSIGTNVLMCRQGEHGGKIYRQRVYSFKINAEKGCIESSIYKLKDESVFEKAEKENMIPESFDARNDAVCLEGCSVLWEYIPSEKRFHGSTTEGTCRFESTFFPGKTIIATSDIYLSAMELWTLDRGVDTDGNKMYGFKCDEHYKFLRYSMYKGIAIVNKAEYEVTLNNQGGKTSLGETTEYVTLYQELMDDGTKVLKLVCKGNEVSEATADCDTEFIGLAFNGIEISLRKEK